MSAKTRAASDEQGFQRVGDLVVDQVRAKLCDLIIAAGDHAEARQAICLGGLAGVVQTWVGLSGSEISRERMAEALTGAIGDFVDQAYQLRRAELS